MLQDLQLFCGFSESAPWSFVCHDTANVPAKSDTGEKVLSM